MREEEVKRSAWARLLNWEVYWLKASISLGKDEVASTLEQARIPRTALSQKQNPSRLRDYPSGQHRSPQLFQAVRPHQSQS